MRMLRSSVLLAALACAPLSVPHSASAAVFVSVSIAPPALPIYVQPPLPAPGYLWAPGYWAYADVGYYWVPGTWVMAPQPGLLWTPPYWGWGGGVYLFHAGYWGPHVGFYGGINYGFGYGGVGYVGGRWNNGVFAYNAAVNHVNFTNVHNVYNERVVNNTTINRVSFNGGAGGVQAQPTPGEAAFEHENHVQATALQAQHQQAASANRAQFASVNHGRPTVAASAQPGAFSGHGVVRAQAAAAHAPGPRPIGPRGPGAPGFHGPAGAPHPIAAGRPAPHPHPQPGPHGGARPPGGDREHH